MGLPTSTCNKVVVESVILLRKKINTYLLLKFCNLMLTKTKYMKSRSFLYLTCLLLIISTVNFSCSKDDAAGTTAPNSIGISSFAFAKASLTVAKGTTVTWTNNDAVAHTVTSDDGTSFSSGTIASGATFSFTFNTAGTFNYHCNFHSGMTAIIIVTP